MHGSRLQKVLTPISELRRSAGFNQEQLAVKAGCSIASVALAERTGLITLGMAQRIAAGLGVPLHRVLRVTGRRGFGVPLIVNQK